MEDNAFGTVVKALVGIWSMLCFAGCWYTGITEAPQDSGAAGFALLFSWVLWGGIWLVPALGGLILYLLFGRSTVQAQPLPRSPVHTAPQAQEESEREKRKEPTPLKTWIERGLAIAILAVVVLGSLLGWWR